MHKQLYRKNYVFLANCGQLSILSGNDSVPRVEALDGILPVEGTTFTFSCPPGLALIGPNSTTCTGNGEWEPDPRGLTCTSKSYNL